VKRIVSRDNANFKALQRLVESSRERKKKGLSLLDGPHLVSVYRERVGAPEQLVVSAAGLENPEIRSSLDRLPATDTLVLSDALFKDISPVMNPTGILAVVRTPSSHPLPHVLDSCIMLEDLQDPGNLGSILRSAAAAGVKHVLLSPKSVHAWSPRVLRAGMGAHFMLQIYEQADLIAAARAFAGIVIATRPGAAHSLYETDLSGEVAFLFGNEGAGLSPALRMRAHAEIAIPMPGHTESLNVAAAIAVCLFERVRQLSADGDHGRAKPGGR
jgi:RNA methyltransferase, TrmH family